MRVSYNWLKKFVDITISPEELADKLSISGLEAVVVNSTLTDLNRVVVGEIRTIDAHPEAEKLSVCKVFNGETELQIVCGARNIEVGQKVPVALVGARLPNGMKIKKSKLRGVVSHGMICSTIELGVGEDAAGIMVLPEDSIAGSDVGDILSKGDTIFEVELTPNRGDCLSIIGVAREVSAILDKPLHIPDDRVDDSKSKESIKDLISVKIDNRVGCYRYASRIIKGITIGSSPEWLQKQLQALGVRPINNIVDITNFILMEWGHPLHAFDYDLLQGKAIRVRSAEKGEKIVTLDGIERSLDEDILVIADSKKPVALAGVMGGLQTSVSEATTTVLLESAYFNFRSIRKTSQKLNLSTESSYRFERGVDAENVITALKQTTLLIQKYCGGEVVRGMIDEYPVEVPTVEISLRPDKVNAVLDTNLSGDEISAILKRLSFTCTKEADSQTIKVTVPSYRNDIAIEEDLIEEIARIYGYENIKSSDYVRRPVDYVRDDDHDIQNRAKQLLISLGFYEVINYSFIGEALWEKLPLSVSEREQGCLKIKNPVSNELNCMRKSLIPGILQTVSMNIKHNIENIKIFELGRIFLPKGEVVLPEEKVMLSGAVCGNKDEIFWGEKPVKADFHYLSGVIHTLLDDFGVKGYSLQRLDGPFYRKGRAAVITQGKNCLVKFGELSSALRDIFNLETGILIFELDFGLFKKALDMKKGFKSLSKFPAVVRDIALLVGDSVSHADILKIIQRTGKEIVKNVTLFDVYTGGQVKEGYRSLAYSVKYQLYDRTLTDSEVNALHMRISDALCKELKVEIRDK